MFGLAGTVLERRYGLAGRSALVAAAMVVLGMQACAAPANTWHQVDSVAPALSSWEGREVGKTFPNPFTDLPAQNVHGRWLRVSGTVDEPRSGMQFLLTVFEQATIRTRSAPALCRPDNVAGRTRCVGLLWVPPEATRVRVVVWASLAPGHIHDVRLEMADTGSPPAAQMRQRLASIIDLVQERYYRSHEVDWPQLREAFAAIPEPPSDVDPLPTLVQLLRDRLPGNRHTSLRLASPVSSASIELPTCDRWQGGVWALHLPATSFKYEDGLRAYVEAAHACLDRTPASTPWVIDLRGNQGGGMHPMLAAVQDFFAPGPLMTFLDESLQVNSDKVAIAPEGLIQSGEVIVPASAPLTGRRAAARVVVVIDSSCGSACETVAIAFRDRPGTRLVGEPTAGLTTGNVGHPINEDYTLTLTEGYMADRCGKRVPERIPPDTVIDPKDEAAAAAELRRLVSARLPGEAPKPCERG
ncbi:S41 family peptidase [Ramlibacter sp. MMS24-I3-19]|uniref:S41 family peptidase n=1 Tax=Ramlibacter sp. MMS24-I3-19 TaxID=3416606 RepID=UPI003CFCE8D5